MLRNVSIKTRLYFSIGLSLMAMLILAGVGAYSVRQGSKSLQSVYENMVVPISILKEMDGDLKDLRFRMLGYLVDQMPAVGNMNHVKEVKQKTPELWAEYKTRIQANTLDEQTRELVEKIDSQFVTLAPFLDKLEAAYLLEKKQKVTQLLEGEWLDSVNGIDVTRRPAPSNTSGVIGPEAIRSVTCSITRQVAAPTSPTSSTDEASACTSRSIAKGSSTSTSRSRTSPSMPSRPRSCTGGSNTTPFLGPATLPTSN